MDPTPIRAPRRAGFLQLAAFVLLAAGLPALVPFRASGRIASSIHAVSRPAEIARLEQEKAEVVVVGDSMVPCRIDPAELTRLTGRRCSLLSFNGSASASWYLLLKNVVGEVEPRPRWAVVFFRDAHFHYPTFRTTGQRQALLDSLRVGTEPELDHVLTGAAARSNRVLDVTADVVDKAWQIDGYGDKALRNVRNLALDLTSLGSEEPYREAVLDYIFSIQHLRGDLARGTAGDAGGEDDPGGKVPAWTDDPAASFLPYMADAAERAGCRLCLYRVKRRPHAAGREDPQPLQAYLAGLREWAVRRGVAYADETADPQLTLDLYADGDHTKESARPQWTARAADHLRAAIEDGARDPAKADARAGE